MHLCANRTHIVLDCQTGGGCVGADSGKMLRASPTLWRGQFQERLKNRLVGHIPKFNPRTAKGMMVALRSEANTGHFEDYFKTEAERMDTTGRKVSKVMYDPVLGRHVVFREAKLKGPFLLKSHIAKAVSRPVGAKP